MVIADLLKTKETRRELIEHIEASERKHRDVSAKPSLMPRHSLRAGSSNFMNASPGSLSSVGDFLSSRKAKTSATRDVESASSHNFSSNAKISIKQPSLDTESQDECQLLIDQYFTDADYPTLEGQG